MTTTRPAARFALLFVALLAPACKRRAAPDLAQVVAVDAGQIAPGNPPPAGDLRANVALFTAAVYQLPRAKGSGDKLLADLAKKSSIEVRMDAPKTKADAPLVAIQHPPIREYAPPSIEALRYSGRTLSDAQKAALQDSKEVTVLLFNAPAARALPTYRSALEMTAALAVETGGLPFDDDTRETYAIDAWRKRLDDWDNDSLPIDRHMVVHAYKDGELLRLVTLGMRKLGLPDVSVNQVSGHDTRTMTSLINVVCQTMLETGTLPRTGEIDVSIPAIKNTRARTTLTSHLSDNATQKATLKLAIVTPQEGDAENRLLEIVFPGPVALLQERHNAVLTQLFGAHDEATAIQHDEAILAASKRAKLRLLDKKPLFAKGRPELVRLVVKAPFKTRSGGNEWMWVEVTAWQGDTVTGILENDPVDVDDLRAGARVEVSQDSLFDYIFEGADGGQEGNETGRLMESAPRLRK